MDELVRAIRANGPMMGAQYMEHCLAHPEHGYYRRAEAIGAQGDFVTSPEINQIFGELIGIWVAATWQQMGEPDTFQLVELGPGRGTMMGDVLRALRVVPGLEARANSTLVEISPHLRSVQRKTLADVPNDVRWLASLQDVVTSTEPMPTIILANEFFDALPVTQFVRRDAEWRERAVDLDENNQLAFVDGPSSQIQHDLPHAKNGDIFETRGPAYREGDPSLQTTLATLAASRPTVLLAIDYGYEGPTLGDTLQAMRAHEYADVLNAPGEQDLTAHVDFIELASICAEAGLQTDGLLTQAAFLAGLGFDARLERLLASKEARQVNAIETAAHRLVAEPGMGNHFRVLGARSAALPPLIPFPAPSLMSR